MTLHAPEKVKVRIREAERLRLFLDYDGTLAEFARTPEEVEPHQEVIKLLTSLAENPHIQVTVISGRRLDHVERLLPVPEVLLSGTYGIELLLPDGEHVDRVPYAEVRPVLKELKPRWQKLIAGREGFFLEDKDWALAIHALRARDEVAEEVLGEAREMAKSAVEAASEGLFRVLGGHKFLEIGPAMAHKGKTVAYLLDDDPSDDALLMYVGDDDKDEEAFQVIHAHDGIAIRVCERSCDTEADGRLESSQDTRRWLQELSTTLSPR